MSTEICRWTALVITSPAFLVGIIIRPFVIAYNCGASLVDHQFKLLFPDDDES